MHLDQLHIASLPNAVLTVVILFCLVYLKMLQMNYNQFQSINPNTMHTSFQAPKIIFSQVMLYINFKITLDRPWFCSNMPYLLGVYGLFQPLRSSSNSLLIQTSTKYRTKALEAAFGYHATRNWEHMPYVKETFRSTFLCYFILF